MTDGRGGWLEVGGVGRHMGGWIWECTTWFVFVCMSLASVIDEKAELYRPQGVSLNTKGSHGHGLGGSV